MIIKHLYQPTGNSCGPTCLKMVYESMGGIKDTKEYTIDMISTWCGTDWIVGTPPDRMELGMKRLGFKYVEYMYSPRPYDLLKEVIDSGNIPILRTITQNVPHWIIINGYSANVFNVLDPWQGEIKYSENQLDEVWKKRQYQFFEILANEN